REKLNGLAGRSVSLAVAVKATITPAFTVRFVKAVRTGGMLTSFTNKMNEFVALKWVAFTAPGLVSVTIVTITFVPGPCASAGVHVITPVLGLIVAVPGATSNEKVSVLVGMSRSVAVLVTASIVSSLSVWFVRDDNVGAVFNTVKVKTVEP